MAGMDFGSAPQNQGGELIPDGALAFGNINIRPKSMEFNQITHTGKDNPENKYLDLEIELTSGPHAGRKIYHMLGVAGSEKWVMMSMAGIRHILEVGKQAGASNPAGYVIGATLPDGDERMWMELDGLQCAIKVSIEKGKEGFKDKNRVGKFLSPHPDSDTNKDFAALVGGASMSASSAAKPATAGAAAAPWAKPAGAPAQNAQPAAPATPPARPSWAGAPPPATPAAKDGIPF